ncbi:MAG: hypothetical protein ACT6FB_06225 [Methanosarcinaceae archaeon]
MVIYPAVVGITEVKYMDEYFKGLIERARYYEQIEMPERESQ